jgi:hypothetical protein
MNFQSINTMPVLGSMISETPIVSVERSPEGRPIRYCVDNETEGTMQAQRLFSILIAGPSILYAATKMDDGLHKRAFVGLIGLATMYVAGYSYWTVKKAEQGS